MLSFLFPRFDKLLYVGVAEDKESQLNIMMALTRRFGTNISITPAQLNSVHIMEI
jgi:hypothetical protein